MFLRDIEPADDVVIAGIIRNTLSEFNAARPGTVYYDPTTDHLSEVFQTPRSRYFIAVEGNSVLGGAGIFPTDGLPLDTCELVKLYLLPVARGKGTGKTLMRACEAAALASGFTKVYLETMPELKIAVPLYEKMGYHYLDAPLGNSGHTGCGIWMMKELVAGDTIPVKG